MRELVTGVRHWWGGVVKRARIRRRLHRMRREMNAMNDVLIDNPWDENVQAMQQAWAKQLWIAQRSEDGDE